MGKVKEFYHKSENKWNKMEERALTDAIVEDEYYSECCEAPPYNEDEVLCNDLLGHCMKCGMGSVFKIINTNGEKNE